jgi:hypothetical protein
VSVGRYSIIGNVVAFIDTIGKYNLLLLGGTTTEAVSERNLGAMLKECVGKALLANKCEVFSILFD